MTGTMFVLVPIGAVALGALWLAHHVGRELMRPRLILAGLLGRCGPDGLRLCPTSTGASGDRESGAPIDLPADDREALSWS